MRFEQMLIRVLGGALVGSALVTSGCGGGGGKVCNPVPSFSSPAVRCVAVAKPKPKPVVVVKAEPKPEPKVEPEPPPPPPPEPEPPPPPPPVVVKQDTIELDRTIQFETGSAKLVDDSKTLLDDVAKVLDEHAEIKKIQLEGHTDTVGGKRQNLKLSNKRAAAVRTYLIGKGIAKTRMTAKGFGQAKPVDDNTTEEGRFKNRRVDIKITKRDDASAADPDKAKDPDKAADADADADADAEKPKPKPKAKAKRKAKPKAPAGE